MTELNKDEHNNSGSNSKKPMFSFKPSILTTTAEAIRTDKVACSSTSRNDKKPLVFFENDFNKSGQDVKPNKVNKDDSSGNSFGIFGQNILSRTTGLKEFKDFTSSDDQKKEEEQTKSEEDPTHTTDNNELRKNAEEIQKQSAVAQLEEAEVVTGEENERSVIRLSSCKLFQFISEKKDWVGKGFCNVHLNDKLPTKDNGYDGQQRTSRLVARSIGGLQVVVNTLIWRDMGLARVGSKSVRLSSAPQSDDGKVVSYLVTAQNQQDADMLYDTLEERRSHLPEKLTTNKNNNSSHSVVKATVKRLHSSPNSSETSPVKDCNKSNDNDDDKSGEGPVLKKSLVTEENSSQ